MKERNSFDGMENIEAYIGFAHKFIYEYFVLNNIIKYYSKNKEYKINHRREKWKKQNLR